MSAATRAVGGMRLMELHALALEEGLDEDAVDVAMDGDDPRAALLVLLQPRPAMGAEAPPSEAATIAAALSNGSAEEREAAYTALEATRDVALAASSVEPLAAVIGKPVGETGGVSDAAEYRHAMGAVAHIVQLDPVVIGGEWFKEMRFLSATAKGNTVDAIVSKPPAELTKDDARTVAAATSVMCTICRRGLDAVFASAGCSIVEWFGARVSQDSAFNAMMRTQPDEPKMMRLVSLVLELLRVDRAELSDTEVAGCFYMFEDFSIGHPAVCLHCVEAGAVGLVLAELRRGSPADWVSISRDPSSRFAAAINAIGNLAINMDEEHKHLLAATPRFLDVLLDCLKAYEAAGSTEDTNIVAVYWLLSALYGAQPALFAFSDINRAAVRGASSIRFVLDNPLDLIKQVGITTSMMAVRRSLR